MEDITLDKTSSSASERVKIELGVDYSATQIKDAIKATGIKDPVKAITVHHWDEVMKAVKTPSKPKPNSFKKCRSRTLTSQR